MAIAQDVHPFGSRLNSKVQTKACSAPQCLDWRVQRFREVSTKINEIFSVASFALKNSNEIPSLTLFKMEP